jgi:hypothetical protein
MPEAQIAAWQVAGVSRRGEFATAPKSIDLIGPRFALELADLGESPLNRGERLFSLWI